MNGTLCGKMPPKTPTTIVKALNGFHIVRKKKQRVDLLLNW